MKLVSAILAVLLGIALLILGSLGVQTFGTAGTLALESPTLESDADAYALVTDVVSVETGLPFSDALGDTTIGASSQNQKSLFIGLAATNQLDEYLLGVPYDVVRDNEGNWETLSVPGAEKPKDPTRQDIWIRRSTGTSPEMRFTPASRGATTFVVMNAAGDSGVTAQLAIGYKSDTVFPLSLAAIVLGVILIALGIWLALRRRQARRRDRPTTAAMPGSSPPPVPATTAASQPAESVPASDAAPPPNSEAAPDSKLESDAEPGAGPPLQGWYRDEDKA
ncbi:MAG: hypothetical protein K0U64_08070 [Actinomycetia bacterium]|nr:hypothetical protein [Actinomycetes bacterium]